MVKSQLGKLAKMRRIVKLLDSTLALCETDEVFGVHEYREVQAMIDALLRARTCAANVLMRLGDDSAYRTQPHVSVEVNYEEL
jgi:hypothetical protein